MTFQQWIWSHLHTQKGRQNKQQNKTVIHKHATVWIKHRKRHNKPSRYLSPRCSELTPSQAINYEKTSTTSQLVHNGFTSKMAFFEVYIRHEMSISRKYLGHVRFRSICCDRGQDLYDFFDVFRAFPHPDGTKS